MIPAVIPVVINTVKKEKVVEKKEIIKSIKPVEKKVVKKVDEQIGLEDFYYALHPNDVKIDIDEAVTFNVEVFIYFFLNSRQNSYTFFSY